MAAATTAPAIPLSQIYAKLEQQDSEWLENTLRQRWQSLTVQEDAISATSLINGNGTATVPMSKEIAPARQQTTLGPYDVTGPDLAPSLVTEHLKRFRSYDWASTELGPMSSWSPELRRIVNLCMADPRPVALWWGPNRILLHNESYRSFLQERDTWALGQPVTKVWYDVPQFWKNYDDVDATGQPAFGEDTLFFVEQADGRLAEFWTSWAIIPLRGATGNIGYYNACSHSTSIILYERRMSTLLALERHTSSVGTILEFWTKIMHGLKANSEDVPFAALYSAESTADKVSAELGQLNFESDIGSYGDTSSSISGDITSSEWVLRGVLESAPGQLQLPSTMNIETAVETMGPLFKTAIETKQPQHLRLADGSFPKSLQSRAVSRAYGDLCNEAIIIPIPRGQRQATSACLVFGLNSRAKYDEGYQRFVTMLRHQLTMTIKSVIMAEAEARHIEMSAALAARDRMQLAEKLDLSQQDAKAKELRFRSMADQSPISMFEVTPDGQLLYVNDSWYELTGFSRDNFVPLSWFAICHPDDHELFAAQWSRLALGESVNFEFRLSKPYISDEYIAGERLEGETWVSAFGYAEKNADGTVRTTLGSLVDISHYKWMQYFQERRTRDALERKRQQEAFMDMTSHEARNPLAAISLCVESITSTIRDMLRHSGDQVTVSRATVESTLESAETIMACVAHQKCIIDDVLTLSKIDSGMLLVSPVEIQPVEEVRRALRLFGGELHNAAIDLQFDVAPSYQDLGVDWVLLDPTRLMQILINLLTNAIKFTKDEAKRRIVVTLSADQQPPASSERVKFMTSSEVDTAGLQQDESIVYLSFRVEDTGRGIEHADLEHLFQRFQQGSRRTHVKYGGSGLGLFICKELARLQGGQIGVSAARGKGSTFAFFVRATHCSPPAKKEVRSGSISNPSVPESAVAGAEKKRIQHVLLVEDNLVNQKVMAKQLRVAGYSVTVANHGQEALDHVLLTHFCKSDGGLELDIILCDLEMPVMGGLECSRRLREMESSGEITGKVPSIAVTANVRAEQQQEAMGAGFDAVITKPFKMGELVQEMDKVYGI